MTLEIDILCMFIDLVTFYSAQTTGQHHVECIHSLKHFLLNISSSLFF